MPVSVNSKWISSILKRIIKTITLKGTGKFVGKHPFTNFNDMLQIVLNSLFTPLPFHSSALSASNFAHSSITGSGDFLAFAALFVFFFGTSSPLSFSLLSLLVSFTALSFLVGDLVVFFGSFLAAPFFFAGEGEGEVV